MEQDVVDNNSERKEKVVGNIKIGDLDYEQLKSIAIIIVVASIVITAGLYSYKIFVDLKYKATFLATPCDLCCKYEPEYRCNKIIVGPLNDSLFPDLKIK